MNNFLVAVCVSVLALTVWSPAGGATHGLPLPVAHWKLDETSGTTAFDESANNNDGTLCGNGVACVPPGGPTVNQPGHLGSAYSFDGVDDVVSVQSSPSIEGFTEFTFSFWVLPTNLNDVDFGIFKGRQSDGTGDYVLGLVNNQVYSMFENTLGVIFDLQSGAVTPGRFSLITTTYDGTKLRTFIDGTLIDSVAATGTVRDSNFALGLGCRADDAGLTCLDFRHDGALDDVRIYNVALNGEQVQDLFLDPEHHQCNALGSAHAINNLVQDLSVPLIMFAVTSSIIASVVIGYNWRLGGKK